MSITLGTRIGPYEVTSLLGEGGMGIVFRARDVKLQRDVALKLLPDHFADDPERLARFQREAQVLASLNHPNIAQIYGLEDSTAQQCIVMELVEGETLADRLKRGALPVDEALQIAGQIAEALEAAHETGIIHRDLKPANIKLTKEGTVKVLDFGLAKVHKRDDAATLSNSPTLIATSFPGVILGTAAYMSPEQVKGTETGQSSDVWAFGCVLYEMLTKRAVFDGGTVGEILSEVLKGEPDWSRLPTETPESIRRLLRRCLQKDRKERLHDIADARIEISEAQESGPIVAVTLVHHALDRRKRLAWVSAFAFMTVIATVEIVWHFRPDASPPEIRLDITTPPNTSSASLAISPDGQKIIFGAPLEGRSRLWLRSLDSVSLRPLAGTEGGGSPFWSPDSRSVGFFAEGKLKRIDLDGGLVQVLANAPVSRGGAWNGDGIILFAPNVAGPILSVSASGGEPVAVTRVEAPQQGAHRFPHFLPDGRHFLYYVTGRPDARGIYIGELDGSSAPRLVDADAAGEYAASKGQLLFVHQGALFTQNFDPVKLKLTGSPHLVTEQITVDGSYRAALSVSAAGPILYRSGAAGGQRQFVWFDRSGKELGKVGGPGDGTNPELSPDGRRIALFRTVNGNQDIWLLETARGVLSRFTFDAANEIFPIWSHDGDRIVFGSNRTGSFDIYIKAATGSGSEDLLLATPQTKTATDWSPDGRFLLFRSLDPKMSYDIWALPMFGDGKPFPVVQTAFEERDAQFSSDVKWIAYQSNESGRVEIYVRPFQRPGIKWQISTNGGAQVRWRHDGKELFYIALDGRLMAVPIRLAATGQAVEAGSPVPLFATHLGGAVSGNDKQEYIVSPDGQRFLMDTTIEEVRSTPLTVILNWRPAR